MNPTNKPLQLPNYIDEINLKSNLLKKEFISYLANCYKFFDVRLGCPPKFEMIRTNFIYKSNVYTARNLLEIICVMARNKINFLPNLEESKQQKLLYDECVFKTFCAISEIGTMELEKLKITIEKSGILDRTVCMAIKDEMTEVFEKTQASVRSLFVNWQA